MSNRATFGKVVEDLDNLALLAEIVKDPKAIAKAQEEYRKQLALTDAEEARAKEARGLFEANEKLAAELEKKKVQLQNAAADNASALEDIEKRKLSLSVSLEKHRSETEAQARFAAKNEEIRKKLEADQAAVDKLKADYEKKNAKLVEVEAALDVRAEKILLREKASEL